MRLLVTGVSGLLGLNLAWLASQRFEVTGVMRGNRVSASASAPFRVITADLTRQGELERVFETAQPDQVIHCAALTDVDRCEMAPEEAFQINTVLPGALACLARKHSIPLLHISTDSVFDGVRGDYSEEDTPNPINTYARTKLAGERAVAEANPDALIARVVFYGWSWQGTRSLSEFFLNSLSSGKPIKGYDDLYFCPLLVSDMIELLLRMQALRLTGIYHVVSSECLSKFDFGRMLARHFGFDENLIIPAPYAAGGSKAPRARNLTLRSEKLARALGEAAPAQDPAARRYYEQYCQGYPQALRSVFVETRSSESNMR